MNNALYQKNPDLYDYDRKEKKKEAPKDSGNAMLALQELLNAMDWTQTRQVARQPDRYTETGPVLNALAGDRPSKGKVNAYFLAKALALAAANKNLPEPYRKIFNALTVLDMGGAIKDNQGIGLDVMRF